MAEIIICDTNIIIEVFKRNLQTISLIESIGTDNLAISSITIMELYFGALNKKELEKIKKSINSMLSLPIHESTII